MLLSNIVPEPRVRIEVEFCNFNLQRSRVGPGKKNTTPGKKILRVSPPLTPGKKNNTLEKKFKHST